jgi:uncharacterized membrane protein required for colicin V production
MNYIDIILIIIAAFGFFIGWKMRGVLVVIIPVAFIAGIITANFFYHPLSALLSSYIKDDSKRTLLSYTIIFALACGIIVSGGFALSRVFDFFNMAFVDRIFGAAILITLLAIPLYLIMRNLGGSDLLPFHKDLAKSTLFPYLKNYVEFIFKIPLLKSFAVVDRLLK